MIGMLFGPDVRTMAHPGQPISAYSTPPGTLYLVDDEGNFILTDDGQKIIINLISWFLVGLTILAGSLMFTAPVEAQVGICALPDNAVADGTDEVITEVNCSGTNDTQRLQLSDLWAGHEGYGSTVTQTAHGFSVTDWVQYNTSNDQWELLDSDTASPDAYAVGYVARVDGANTFGIITEGFVTETAHGLSLGPLFATSTAGAVTTTAPALGTIEWNVGVAVDANTILIQQKEWTQL